MTVAFVWNTVKGHVRLRIVGFPMRLLDVQRGDACRVESGGRSEGLRGARVLKHASRPFASAVVLAWENKFGP